MDVIKRLQNHNIKPSVQRIAIMSYLMEHRTHPSVDEIYTALAPSIPTLSKTLLAQKFQSVHAHFLCKQCGKIYDLEYNANIKQVEDMDMDGYDVQEIHYYYKGICKNCLESEQLTKITNN